MAHKVVANYAIAANFSLELTRKNRRKIRIEEDEKPEFIEKALSQLHELTRESLKKIRNGETDLPLVLELYDADFHESEDTK
jgi:hypothetical protein